MINTSFYTGIGTVIGFISGFVVNKVVAIVVGPGGLAIVSQFQNFVGMTTAIGTGGINQGVVKYVAEARQSEEERAKILSTSLRITLLFTSVVGVNLLLFSEALSLKIFATVEYSYIIVVFGCTVILFSLNQLLLSILNGIGEIKKFVLVNVSSNMFSLLVTSSLAFFYGLSGALLALALSQSIIFFISLLFVVRSTLFNRKLFASGFDYDYSKKLFEYSLMAITSMIIPPMVQIAVRNHISEILSIEQAGYWDGMGKISAAYLGVITTTLSVYYLPKLSSLKDRLLIRRELINGYVIITPLLIVSILVIYLIREYIILILYSHAFLDMKKLFMPQLIGDFFKIMSWLLAFLMLAKAKTSLFIGTQLIFSVILYILSVKLTIVFGLEGVIYAHLINYVGYFITMLVLFRGFLLK